MTGQSVIVASERAQRPIQEAPTQPDWPAETCPFCEGRETQTPPETHAIRSSGEPNGPGWLVRVVPNRFPALRTDLPGPKAIAKFPFESRPGLGVHEILIEHPTHITNVLDGGSDQLGRVLEVFAARIRTLLAEPDIEYVFAFKNSGMAAGASQPHVHSQIVAMPFTPPNIAEEVRRSVDYSQRPGGCLLCRIIAEELRVGQRVIAVTERFVAYSPFASRFPFEICVAPRSHGSRFESASKLDIAALGSLLFETLERLRLAAKEPAFNLYLHTAPRADCEAYHWHFEIAPRIVGLAGFELGGGGFINPVPPEWAAERLRATKH